jgi:hypothetical protein
MVILLQEGKVYNKNILAQENNSDNAYSRLNWRFRDSAGIVGT